MRIATLVVLFCAAAASVRAAEKKVEKPVEFVPAVADGIVGDWQGSSGPVAQVSLAAGGKYRANLFKQFDGEAGPMAAMEGTRAGDVVTFSGGGWSGKIEGERFVGENAGEHFEIKRVSRPSPTLGASAPPGAVVLFDGTNMDAWAKKNGKEWLVEDGPAKWKLVEGGAMEVVAGADCLISKRKFGDCRVHVEFRTLGTPTNSGVFFQTRYELNINETYGRIDGTANAGFDNCSTVKPRIRACRPPLEWQTFDVDFSAPRFDATGKKTAAARATVSFNGVKIYDNVALDPPHGAARRLGEAPTGPLMLQEHGMPVQFRNIWVLERKD